jgi:single-stranded-DNA-specific exonuclease
MEKVIVRREVAGAGVGLQSLHPLLQRIYAAREISEMGQISRELKDLIPFHSLMGIDAASELLAEAVSQDKRILIIGDFDVDGATSTAVAVTALNAMGAKHVDYLVPNRFTYGYGLTPEIVNVAKMMSPDLIVTVDNGISSHAGVDRANSLGIDVLVTDHHLAGESLPNAKAIVNPNQPSDAFPSKCMAGVGVIFYVMLALRAYLLAKGWFEKQGIDCPNMAQFLDLVALGTVADVVPLDKNNRILVYQGLRRIQQGKGRVGIKALMQVAGREETKLEAADFGFALGPRLNAAGRLDDMAEGIACLLAKSLQEALPKAQQLDDLNKERKVIEQQMREEAFAALGSLKFGKSVPVGVCLYQEDWHQGVVGLVASRVKEKLNRPVIAFAKADESMLKGSARSVMGLHIRDVLQNINAKHPDLIDKFGGHAMAAGLSIAAENYERFSRAFAAEVGLCVSEGDLKGKIDSDGELASDEFSLEIAEMLKGAGPWGQGFLEPLFDGVFQVVDQRLVGGSHLKLTLKNLGFHILIEAIAFNIETDKWPNYHCEQVKIAYRLDINEYNNRRRLQLIIEDLQPVAV